MAVRTAPALCASGRSPDFYYHHMKIYMLQAILIDCIPPTLSKADAEARLMEADSLIKTYGGVTLVKKVQKRLTPHYRTYIGPGKAEELLQDAKVLGANIVIVNNELKPAQVYKLTEMYRKDNIQVWDRIDLILKIFQKHASTKEAKLEIELAGIRHMGPRIFGMGLEMSRQGGGGKGAMRGLGETNTEVMKRHLFDQELHVKKELDACIRARELHLKARKRQNFSTLGIIGYTNAGKSTLLNHLTHKGAYAADKLFATLDTRVGKVFIPTLGKEVLLSDTIGFIQDLPHTLINSFQSTLAETLNADILLHVIDVSDERIHQKIAVVHDVLDEIGAGHYPMMYVFNKTDRGFAIPKEDLLERYAEYTPVFVSAVEAEGIEVLKDTIAERISSL